nr:hypothetical protein [uncultured Schaedlerella sp.]
MNIDIARKRYMDVIRPDVMHNSKGDFLATHVPMKKLYVTEHLTDHAEVPEQDKKHPKTEEEVYEQFMGEKEEDQFVLVIGDSGAGKSHLIRWIDSVLEIRKSENEIVLPIRRADNTLKGTIRQLIELPEVKELPNRELYKKLASAATTVPERELKETIYYQFIIQITNDDGKAGDEEGERKLSNVDRKHLIALLQNSLFKTRLMDDDGPVDRIYGKFAENKTSDVNDKAPEFVREDFEIDAEFRNQLYLGADDKARKIADKLLGKPEFVDSVKEYMNLFVDKVIQRCAGLEPGDLANVIEEIRQELFKQGKTLTILIEDITAASGVDDSLLDALLTDKIEYPDKNMCRLNAVVGSTDGYYREKFRSNTKGRIHNFVYVPDDLFSGNQNGLIEFFAKYLNTISLTAEDVWKWVEGGKADLSAYPIHVDTIGKGWGEYNYGGKNINIFPFTKNAILFLYDKQDLAKRNPRALMREIIEPYINDAMDHLEEFPLRRPSFQVSNTELQNAIYNNGSLDDATKIRLSFFMYIWGDGTLRSFERNGEKYIAGIPLSVYQQLGLPVIDGVRVADGGGQAEQDAHTEGQSSGQNEAVPLVEELNEKENEQVLIALAEVDRWIEQKDYKLSIGATTKNVRALNDARNNIKNYLFDTIDWLSEGVSIDAMRKIRDTGNKYLVAFDRQTMKSDAVITLPASIESRKIIEAFVRWSEVGKKSWNFKGSTDYLYRVQRWRDSIKPSIVNAIMHYNDKESEYFIYATAAEYYRLILNGYCKNYQNPQNFTAEMLLGKNPPNTDSNAHTKTWNDLLKIANGSDGMEAHNCVLQYYNLPQGTAITSTNYEFDYVSFHKAVRKVIRTGLHFTDGELQLDDPVKKRRMYSEHLHKILERIDTVVNDEKAALSSQMQIIAELIDIDELEESGDVEDIVKKIGQFYSQAQTSHVRIAVHYDTGKINACKRNASRILSAIKNAREIMDTEDSVEALIRLSRDPMQGLRPFVELLDLVSADVGKADSEVEQRVASKGLDLGKTAENPFTAEEERLAMCHAAIEEVKKDHVNG